MTDAMTASTNATNRAMPATPWGLLPPRMRVLYVTTPARRGDWLADAFASDSACDVALVEAHGAAPGLARLRDQAFDAVLVSHAPPELDALEFVDGLRAGGAEEPLVILGQPSEQEMAALCYEVGADGYVCTHTVTTRTVLWIVARAIERHQLIRENRRLMQAERHRLQQERHEAERMLTEQRSMARDAHPALRILPQEEPDGAAAEPEAAGDGRPGAAANAPPLDGPLASHYREVLRAHVIMGSGNLSGEMAELAEMLAAGGVTAPQTMHLHVHVLEELVRGLGNRSARHVMARADLLLLEILVHLAERYRLRAELPAPAGPLATRTSEG
jgi:DNA-binding response OmpR family regulator